MASSVYSVSYSNNFSSYCRDGICQTEDKGCPCSPKGGEEDKRRQGETSSTPKASSKQAKRKPDGSDRRPAKKAVVTPGNGAAKEKSPPKPSHGAGKGAMTSLGLVNEGLCRFLTHKDYAIGEVKSFIKPADIEPCDQLGTKDLRATALFDLTRVCLLLFCRNGFILL